jgi:hypothetical protein
MDELPQRGASPISLDAIIVSYPDNWGQASELRPKPISNFLVLFPLMTSSPSCRGRANPLKWQIINLFFFMVLQN